jgi:hypothetical protein
MSRSPLFLVEEEPERLIRAIETALTRPNRPLGRDSLRTNARKPWRVRYFCYAQSENRPQFSYRTELSFGGIPAAANDSQLDSQ